MTLIVNTKLGLFSELANFFWKKMKLIYKISPINVLLIGPKLRHPKKEDSVNPLSYGYEV